MKQTGNTRHRKAKKLLKFIISKHSLYSAIINIPIFTTAAICLVLFYKTTDFGTGINLLALLIIVPTVLFQYFVQVKDFENLPESINEVKADRSKGVQYSKHLANYLTLLLFYSGLIVTIEYFKPLSHTLDIPKLQPGTVGFRSNNAEVQICDIEIWYQDSLNNWLKVSPELICDKKNWLMPVKPRSDSADSTSLKSIYVAKDTFIIKNTTLLFFPPQNILNSRFGNVQLTATVKFLQEPVGSNPGIAFITNRDLRVQKYQSKKNERCILGTDKKNQPILSAEHYDVNDLCLEFSFPYNNYAHPWIPALEWMPAITQRSSFLDVENSKLYIEKVKAPDVYYKLSAFVFDGQVRFTLNDENYKGVKCLFEAKIQNSTENH